MTAFWQRVYTNIQGLVLSVETNWEEYRPTDEEILSIPFHLPAILREEKIDTMATQIRPKLYRLRMYLLISFAPSEQPPIQPRDTEFAKLVINQRIRILEPNEIQGNGETVKQKLLSRETMKVFATLRRLWPSMLSEFLPKFVERLKEIKEPSSESAIVGISHATSYFDVTRTHDLIPWHKLTLAGIPCRDYTIKQARKNAKNHIIIPNWKPEEVRQPSSLLDIEKYWKGVWKTLNWKSRPDEHYQAYWYFLHKRAPRFQDWKSNNAATTTTNQKEHWHTMACNFCYKKDTHLQAYLECEEVRNI